MCPSHGVSQAFISAKLAPHTELCSLFSPSASFPSGLVSSPGSIPATVPVQMTKPSRVQQALAGRHAAVGLWGPEGLCLAGFGGGGRRLWNKGLVTLCILMET